MLPWIAGLLVSVVVLGLAPLPPLAALLSVVVITTWIAWAVDLAHVLERITANESSTLCQVEDRVKERQLVVERSDRYAFAQFGISLHFSPECCH